MPRNVDEQVNEDMLTPSGKKGISIGAEIRRLFQEMQEAIVQLQAMRDYARDNGYHTIVKDLDIVIQSFDDLKRGYASARVLDEIKKTAVLSESHPKNNRINKVKSALTTAKERMRGQKEELFSLLMKSHLQLVYENTRNFFDPKNKFEKLLEKLANFESLQKNETAKNSSRFFSTSSKTKSKSTASVQVIDSLSHIKRK